MEQQLIERALLKLNSAYPYEMNAENLKIEYLELFDRDDTKLTVEQMAIRMIRALE
ncbi:hypothetical protein [Alicyclobacillus acidoterrestris]|uniref:Uncharacterized protein n=1 Tax=Alicyclobacillus acidoterrestris (strain ATCC 49025 / DSM 3922 / CIP 106132 / NCIMB 13137 / GD3B) TaxID=1356854 RepID=T0BUB2_ALIAG|nr:hypothetical protein [Alicyclobacillus acidoterrestris]EPZ47678.1 hypothetical protein N007_05335 [Alicyclobacillus acidoterrestris ATCC 49025]UNO48003.1 hypothetical protein K1I37_15115 [Alicyclobacillus acidoterrestris]